LQLGSEEAAAFSYMQIFPRLYQWSLSQQMQNGEKDRCFRVVVKPYSRRKNEIMKTNKLVILILTIAVALFVLIPNLSWAEDGAATYKAKCAMCHGADAAGKPAAKIPSLVSDDAKKASDADLAKSVTETAKHPAAVKSLPADDVKAIVTYIRSLQK
jgi:cytochrome c553